MVRWLDVCPPRRTVDVIVPIGSAYGGRKLRKTARRHFLRRFYFGQRPNCTTSRSSSRRPVEQSWHRYEMSERKQQQHYSIYIKDLHAWPWNERLVAAFYQLGPGASSSWWPIHGWPRGGEERGSTLVSSSLSSSSWWAMLWWYAGLSK